MLYDALKSVFRLRANIPSLVLKSESVFSLSVTPNQGSIQIKSPSGFAHMPKYSKSLKVTDKTGPFVLWLKLTFLDFRSFKMRASLLNKECSKKRVSDLLKSGRVSPLKRPSLFNR